MGVYLQSHTGDQRRYQDKLVAKYPDQREHILNPSEMSSDADYSSVFFFGGGNLCRMSGDNIVSQAFKLYLKGHGKGGRPLTRWSDQMRSDIGFVGSRAACRK